MQLSTTDIVNSVAEKLRKEGFSEKDIEMAIQKAKQHYDAYLKSVKNPKTTTVNNISEFLTVKRNPFFHVGICHTITARHHMVSSIYMRIKVIPLKTPV